MLNAGSTIGKEEAQKLMDEYDKIITDFSKVESLITSQNQSETFANYLDSIIKKKNCFIFDAEIVERFFKGENGQEKASHFLVIMGAKDRGENEIKKGTPTVILVGCKQDEKDPKKFLSLRGFDGEEGSQHPNYTMQVTFPKAPPIIEEPLVFTIE